MEANYYLSVCFATVGTNQPMGWGKGEGGLTLKVLLTSQRAEQPGSFCLLVRYVLRAKACLNLLELCRFIFDD